MTRVAVATGIYYRERETQIANHIVNLSGGNAIVVAKRRGEPDPFGKPHLIVKEADRSLSISQRLWGEAMATLSYRKNGNLRVPYGGRRRAIVRFLKDHGATAILCEFATEAIKMVPVGESAGLPVFTMLRGGDASAFLMRENQVEALRRAVPRLAGVFSVSQYLLDNLASHGITHPQSFVFPSGVDTERFRPEEKVPGSVLAVGRFIEKKRPDVTVRAFAAAARDRPDARLEMIGEGPMRTKCEALARAEGVEGKVIFHGLKPHDFVRERLARAAIFAQHSVTGADGDTEGLPTSIQEAMASGAAILSTRHAGIPEAVREGETGLLVDEGDAAGYAAALGRMLSGETDLSAMGARAREVAVERFDQATILRALEAKIEELS